MLRHWGPSAVLIFGQINRLNEFGVADASDGEALDEDVVAGGMRRRAAVFRLHLLEDKTKEVDRQEQSRHESTVV